MGSNDTGMQKQRAARKEVVHRKWNFSDDILLMGAGGANKSVRGNEEARGASFSRTTSAETGVTKRIGMFRHNTNQGWMHRISPRNESGTDQKPE